ncbi:hypothetical protein AWC18_10500 [Mycolicibacter nonchromogenicus]|uniref:Uncharacterized protein n=2 Tax=Mycolicibacter nonchromogenicus TaxID=1782 RepID=A0A1X1ZD61_MYCNO|nr:hypothetical protein AWC18_10500 [Mycolicibacter nonchromogenicus]
MPDSSDRPSVVTRVLLLGDRETVEHRADLATDASRQHCMVIDAFGFEEGEAGGTDDLTEVNAVVIALGRAIAGRMDVWVPFPGPDFIREQHLRRMSLVLQRHGLNLRLTRELFSAPTDGGMNEIDFALRREVQAVDDLDQAALAAEGAESLSRQIEQALTANRGPQVVRRIPTDATRGSRHPGPPALPPPALPWPERKQQLERYVRWLVDGCGVTQAATARVLNSSGQRTPTGRPWKPGTVSRLLNGKYDGPRRPGDFTPDAVAG